VETVVVGTGVKIRTHFVVGVGIEGRSGVVSGVGTSFVVRIGFIVGACVEVGAGL